MYSSLWRGIGKLGTIRRLPRSPERAEEALPPEAQLQSVGVSLKDRGGERGTVDMHGAGLRFSCRTTFWLDFSRVV